MSGIVKVVDADVRLFGKPLSMLLAVVPAILPELIWEDAFAQKPLLAWLGIGVAIAWAAFVGWRLMAVEMHDWRTGKARELEELDR